MKSLITPLAHIKAITKKQGGSMTLEAALVFPLIVFVFLFCYMLVMASTIQMTMKAVAYSTVTHIADNIHVIDEIGQIVKAEANYTPHGETKEVSTSNMEQQLLNLLPDPIYSIIVEGKKGNWWPAMNLATTVIGKELIEYIVLELPESRALDKNQLSLVYLQLPDIVNYTDPTVKITLQYEFPFKVPLINKRFVIREQASQRAWLPDARGSDFTISEDDMFIQVISLTPKPLYRGNYAEILVKTKPNTSLSLAISYKSGNSVARNLGVATSNEEGLVKWKWLVSGNTTPGFWQYDITEVGGEAKSVGLFEVRKK